MTETQNRSIETRKEILADYADVVTPKALEVIKALAPLDARRVELMQKRTLRRLERAEKKERITFLDPESTIGGTSIMPVRAVSTSMRGIMASARRARFQPRMAGWLRKA